MRTHTYMLQLALPVMAACGASSSRTPDHGGEPFSVTAPSGGLGRDCPATPPAQGSPCAKPGGLQCEYGSDWDSECNTLADCYTPQATWEIRSPSTIPGQCPTPPTGGASCPDTPEQATGTCSAVGTICEYAPHALCSCFDNGEVTNQGPVGPEWFCETGHEAPCPATRPRIGSTCPASAEDTTCQYQICGRGGVTWCHAGIWLEGIAINMCQ
jgi:hypothetical protein